MSQIETIMDNMITWSVNAGWNILGAIVIYVVGRYLIKLVMRLTRNVLENRKVEASVKTFLLSFVNIALTILLIIAIAARLGVETTSFAALLASAAIQIFHTIITGTDNKEVFIPNGVLSSGSIINYSINPIRRMEWVVGVEYGENFDRVEAVLLKMFNEEPRILQDPAPYVILKEMADSKVNIVIRAWVKNEDYYMIFDMNRLIYAICNKEGINFPFPQLTVHQG